MLTDGHPSGSVTRLRELVEYHRDRAKALERGEVLGPKTEATLRRQFADELERAIMAAALAPAVVPSVDQICDVCGVSPAFGLAAHGATILRSCGACGTPLQWDRSATPPVVAPVAAPVQEKDIELVADLCDRYQMTETFKARIVNALRQSPSLPLTGGRAGLDYVKVLNDAKAIVRESVLWRRFIDGTPLENDIAVWMADFVFSQLRDALTRPQGGESDG